jgi:hypothetical protein
MSDAVQEDLDYKKRKDTYEAGYRNWEFLNKNKEDQEKQFDKTAFAVAAGSFGVSFAFIDKIVPMEAAIYKPILTIAWACFGACLLMIVIGYRISSLIFLAMSEEEKRNIQNRYEGKPEVYKKRNVFFHPCALLNHLTMLFNIGGIICLVLFVYLNF